PTFQAAARRAAVLAPAAGSLGAFGFRRAGKAEQSGELGVGESAGKDTTDQPATFFLLCDMLDANQERFFELGGFFQDLDDEYAVGTDGDRKMQSQANLREVVELAGREQVGLVAEETPGNGDAAALTADVTTLGYPALLTVRRL